MSDKLLLALKAHQVNRLRETYADLLDSPEYHELCEFFFSEIYGPYDYSERNQAFKRLSYFLKDAMGARIFKGIEQLIELNDLTDLLDQAIVRELIKMGVKDKFTNQQYQAAYRKCDNYGERVQQIELLVTSTTFMHGLSKLSAIGWIIRGVRLAAGFIGVGEVMKFLDRGYHAFRSTEDMREFNEVVKERELSRLNKIYGL